MRQRLRRGHAAVLHEFSPYVDLAEPADLEKKCRIHEGMVVHCGHVAPKVGAAGKPYRKSPMAS